MVRATVFLVVCILLAGCQGQRAGTADVVDTGTLVLHILDSERVGVPGVRVDVDHGPPQSTNETGFVVFLGLEPGDHSWSASLDGFIPVERRFSVAGNEVAFIQGTLLATSPPFEVNYYFGNIDCTDDSVDGPCEGTYKQFKGRGSEGMPGGFRNATLRAEWSGGGEFAFRLEARRNGSALPFGDHSFNQSYAGASPLIVQLPRELVSPPMRLGGVNFGVRTDQAPAPTHVLLSFGAYSEAGANRSFPSLHVVDEHTINGTTEAERAWTFDAGASDVLLVDATFERDCPTGSHHGTWLSYTDGAGDGIDRQAQPGPDGDYRCGVALSVPPDFARTADLGSQFLWGNATWTLALAGDCTCRVHLRVLEGMVPL